MEQSEETGGAGQAGDVPVGLAEIISVANAIDMLTEAVEKLALLACSIEQRVTDLEEKAR